CSSCSCLFRCLSDSIPPRSILASLGQLLLSCCSYFPLSRVRLSKSLGNYRRFLLTSSLTCSIIIACCSFLFPFFYKSFSMFCFLHLLNCFYRLVVALFHFLVSIYQNRLQILGVFF